MVCKPISCSIYRTMILISYDSIYYLSYIIMNTTLLALAIHLELIKEEEAMTYINEDDLHSEFIEWIAPILEYCEQLIDDWVFTVYEWEDEADTAWEDILWNEIKDWIYPMKNRWSRSVDLDTYQIKYVYDFMPSDRTYALSRYDWMEYEVSFNNQDYYIYQQNDFILKQFPLWKNS